MPCQNGNFGPAGADYPGTRPTEKWGNTVDTTRIAQPHSADHNHQDERPHACNDGWIKLGHRVDPETGEESGCSSPPSGPAAVPLLP